MFAIATTVLQKWDSSTHFYHYPHLFLPSMFLIVNNKSIASWLINNHNIIFIP